MSLILSEIAAASLESLAQVLNAAMEHVQPATRMVLGQQANQHYGILKKYLEQPPIVATDSEGNALPPAEAAKPAAP